LAEKRAERSGGGMVLMLSARVPTFVTYSLVKLLNPRSPDWSRARAPAATQEAEED
jgi:hypothetical protein